MVQVCQGASMQKCKYVNVQVCKCASVLMYKCANVQVCKCASVQISKCANEQCESVQKYKCANVQVCKFASMQMYKYANLLVCRPVQSLNVCLFFSVSTRLMAIGLVLKQKRKLLIETPTDQPTHYECGVRANEQKDEPSTSASILGGFE